jgi:hypothetical protein
MVSLHRALEENAICRSPLLGGHLARGELRGLYKLHLLHTPVPHDFATLLQVGAGPRPPVAPTGRHARCRRAAQAGFLRSHMP